MTTHPSKPDRPEQTEPTHCRRCGTCCRKGGPALHHQDKDLVMEGRLPIDHLLTLRKGEAVFDNVQRQNIRLDEEIVRIKNRPQGQGCIFWIPEQNACGIYPHRPLECRLLTCWDPRALQKMYRRQRLGRKDLLGDSQEWLRIVENHEKRCSYDRIFRLAGRLPDPPDPAVLGELKDILAYDYHLRRTMKEQGPIGNETLDFLLGSPVWQTAERYGLICRRDGDRFFIRYAPEKK